ncbi:hypothetical protein [Pedobacter sp. MW01-1-1]|uniref:hypothetical protein n=1 Tax=Pedobacter sp. MW01-1-1 TaxID=3383027 RepID=UPI003FEFECCD
MEQKYLGSEVFCFGGGSGGGEWGDMAPEAELGGGGGGSGDYTSMFDCNNDLNGSAFIDPNCGCIGGNTGVSECPPLIEVKQDSLQKYYP